MFCLSIYKRLPNAYRFLAKYLFFPSPSTLKKELQKVPLRTGCSKVITEYLKLLAKEITPQDLNCILMWNEMSIQANLTYDKIIDLIVGFEDWGSKRTRHFADHCIVFYLKCLSSGKHMPIGYGFCSGTTSSIQLARCIKEWITVLINCGFKVIATVCDQGATNIGAINYLISETQLILKSK